MASRAVFLDRDGVVNRALVREGKPYPPRDLSELEVPLGTAEALEELRAAGYLLIVITNQPDVARGNQSRAMVEAINAALRARLPLDEIRVCYHDDVDRCSCRKPEPGLILDAARERGIDLAASYTIGDRWRDVEAGERAGTTTIFIDYGYREAPPSRFDAKVSSLAEAASWIRSRERSGQA